MGAVADVSTGRVCSKCRAALANLRPVDPAPGSHRERVSRAAEEMAKIHRGALKRLADDDRQGTPVDPAPGSRGEE
jgi:hypothetical protein